MTLKSVYITKEAEEALKNHVFSNKNLEVGGLFVGFRCTIIDQSDKINKEQILFITKTIPGDCISTRSHVIIKSTTYDLAWSEIDKSKDLNLIVVGWYHTHPDFGIFLSSTDKMNMKKNNPKPYQIAVVIDGIRKQRGTFCWKNEDCRELINIPYKILKKDNYHDYIRVNKNEEMLI